MRNLIFSLFTFISLPIAAQNWAAIGYFNNDIRSLYVDTTQNELDIVGDFAIVNNDTITGIINLNKLSDTYENKQKNKICSHK